MPPAPRPRRWRGCLFGLQHGVNGLFNLSAENCRIREVAEEIHKAIPNTKIVYQDLKFEDQRNYRVNCDAFRKLGWKPKFTMLDGVREIYRVIHEGIKILTIRFTTTPTISTKGTPGLLISNEPKLLGGGKAFDDRGSSCSSTNSISPTFSDSIKSRTTRWGFSCVWHAHRKEGKFAYVASGAAWSAPSISKPRKSRSSWSSYAESPKSLDSAEPANGFMNLLDNTIVLFFSTATMEDTKGDDIRFLTINGHLEKDYR